MLKKWKKQGHHNDEKTRGVRYKDSDINVEVDDKNEEVLQYGGLDVNGNIKHALSLNPKMMTYTKISPDEIEVEIEKGIIKQRYEQMSSQNVHDREEEEVDEVVNLEKKTIDYSKVRATQIPTNPRLHMPKPCTLRQETAMSEMKERMVEKVNEYVRNKCDKMACIQRIN